MRTATLALALVCGVAGPAAAEDKAMTALDFKMKGIDGKEVDLAQYKGKVVLFVNVASECGYTPQYAGLQELFTKYGKSGLVVVGVPSNEYGAQEPGSDEAIQKFCASNYKVTFPMLSKVSIKGANKVPLYKHLTAATADKKEVGWNFEKFLVDRQGKVVARFNSGVEPTADELTKAISAALAAK